MPSKVAEKRGLMNEFKVWVITDALSVATRFTLGEFYFIIKLI